MTHRQRIHQKKAFLESFAETGNVSESCRAIGIARCTVYDWQEHDDQFAAGWRDAEIQATELLETVARRRAVDGVTSETPILYRGETVASVMETKYSEHVQLQHADADGGRLSLSAVEEYVQHALSSGD